MNLDKAKSSPNDYFRVGYDRYSGNYLMETDDTLGNNRYFIITEEQYRCFDDKPDKLESLYKECVKKNNRSEFFYFSNMEMENSSEQNKRMWEYTYMDMLMRKSRNEIHRRIGTPDIVDSDKNAEIYKMSSNLEICIKYQNDKSTDIDFCWNE